MIESGAPQSPYSLGGKDENPVFLREQIITYIGNKRALLPFILEAVEHVRHELGGRALATADLFCGSGIVARALRRHSGQMVVNDLEGYCATLSRCYLSCSFQRDKPALRAHHAALLESLSGALRPGLIAAGYAPQDAEHIGPHERAFYTPRNARYIDTARQLIGALPPAVQPFFLAPLLVEASIKANTAGVFKGFYKDSATGAGRFGGRGRDALSRICADIALPFPIFSAYDCPTGIYQQDAVGLAADLDRLDLVYLDPPYNQHPYGSNYFMLNLINDYRDPGPVSPVSGIPRDWNRSAYNRRQAALPALVELCRCLRARYILISMNDEGFIHRAALETQLKQMGRLTVMAQPYNTFRGSRNLRARGIHTMEYLFLLKKD